MHNNLPSIGGSGAFESYSLEEVLFAVDAVAPAEALLGQLGLAVAALQALAVPVAVQHFEDEAVHDVLAAARAYWDLCGRHDGITTTFHHQFSVYVRHVKLHGGERIAERHTERQLNLRIVFNLW